jgi:small GTP-binding protein
MAEHTCTLAVLGDGSVGKSTIITAFRTEGFQPVYKQTVGCDFYEKLLVIKNTTRISLRVWDIGGQSIHSKNLRQYVESTNAVMLVYDVTNPESFANIQDWLLQLRKYNATSFVYLIGNKVDMIALRQVTERQHDAFVVDNGLQGGAFCSAKTGENIVKLFYRIAGEIVGEPLSQEELAFYDKVLKAHITVETNGNDERRNEWADEIEREDMEAERKKREREAGGCACCMS